MTSPRVPRPVAVPISDDLRRRLVELGQWHDEWVADQEADTRFRRRPADHNMHYVDMDAAPDGQDEFHTRADQIMGVTGQSVLDRWVEDERLDVETDVPE